MNPMANPSPPKRTDRSPREKPDDPSSKRKKNVNFEEDLTSPIEIHDSSPHDSGDLHLPKRKPAMRKPSPEQTREAAFPMYRQSSPSPPIVTRDSVGRVIREVTHTVRHNPVVVGAVADASRWRDAWEREKAMRETERREFRDKLLEVETMNRNMCDQWEARIRALEQEKDNAWKENQKLSMEIQFLNSKFEAKEKMVNHVTKVNENLGDEVLNLEENICKRSEKISYLEAVNKSNTTLLEEAKSDLSTKNLMIAKLNQEVEQLTDENEDLQEKLRQVHYSSSQEATVIQNSKAEIVSLKTQFEGLTEERASENRRQEEMSEYCRELEHQLQQLNHRIAAERVDLQQITTVSSKKEKDLAMAVEKLGDERNKLAKDNEKLSLDVKSKISLIETTMAASTAARNEASQEREKRKNLERELHDRENAMLLLKTDFSVLKETMEKHVDELSIRLDEERGSTKVLRDSLNAEIDNIKRRLSVAQNQLSQKSNECDRLEHNLKTEARNVADLKTENGNLSKKIDELCHVRNTLAERVHRDESTSSMMTQSIELIKKETQLLKNEYIICQNHLLSERSKNKELEAKVDELASNLLQLSDQHTKESFKLKELASSNCSLQADNKILREKFERKSKEAEGLFSELQRTKDNLSKCLNEKLRFMHDVNRVEQESMLLRASLGAEATPAKLFSGLDSKVHVERLSQLSPQDTK